jgi:N-acetylglucosamine-6-sulfatase
MLTTAAVIYTSDNGYHVGQHRAPAGKSLYFAEDTNLPFIVRGPGVPANVTSTTPGLHLDLAPTFLDIAGVSQDDWPEFFDGRSLLDQWHNPTSGNGDGAGQGNGKESINVEYWGNAGIEAPSGGVLGSPFSNTTYKTIRTLGEDQSWLYTKWCSGETELYNTADDSYELTNLVPSGDYTQVINRLNTLLMVTKSCEQGACRDPWSLINPPDGSTITTLTQAMDAKYDDFFADFPKVSFEQCLIIQDDQNEAPYYPELQEGSLGRAYRDPTDSIAGAGGASKITVTALHGTEAQRSATLEDINGASRPLTAEELAAR